MSVKRLTVRTTYIPVTNVNFSSEWYENKVGAELSWIASAEL